MITQDFYANAKRFAADAKAAGATNAEINEFLSARMAEQFAEQQESRQSKQIIKGDDGVTYLVDLNTGDFQPIGNQPNYDELEALEMEAMGATGSTSAGTTPPAVTETGMATTDGSSRNKLGSPKEDITPQKLKSSLFGGKNASGMLAGLPGTSMKDIWFNLKDLPQELVNRAMGNYDPLKDTKLQRTDQKPGLKLKW